MTNLPTPEDLEDFGDGIKRYWLFNHRVAVFESRGESRTTVETWYRVTLETLQNWPDDQESITIHDFSQSSPTNYARGRARDLAKALHDAHGHNILVVDKSLVGHLIQIFVNTGLGNNQPRMQRYVFNNMEEALNLAEHLIQETPLS